MSGRFDGNHHPAMLPLLMMMTQSGKEMEQSLDNLVSFIQSTKNALEAMRSGMETFQAGMLKMVPPSGQKGVPGMWPGSPPPTPPKKKFTEAPLPVKEPDNEAVKENKEVPAPVDGGG